jgi:hypothetical protein
MTVEREKLFQANGTLRGLSYAKGRNRRGAILNVGIDRKSAKTLVTSLIVDGRDFGQVYRQMVYMIADHYDIPLHHYLVVEMLNSKDAFLLANGLTTKPVCYEQVVLAGE